jgi:hypothetical protein
VFSSLRRGEPDGWIVAGGGDRNAAVPAAGPAASRRRACGLIES